MAWAGKRGTIAHPPHHAAGVHFLLGQHQYEGLGQGRKSLVGLSHKPLPRGKAASCLNLLPTPT